MQNYGGDWLKKFGVDPPASADSCKNRSAISSGRARNMARQFPELAVDRAGRRWSAIIALVVVTPVVTFYLLLSWPEMVCDLRSLIPPRYRATAFDPGRRNRPRALPVFCAASRWSACSLGRGMASASP